jgi:hypothetical protein
MVEAAYSAEVEAEASVPAAVTSVASAASGGMGLAVIPEIVSTWTK